MTTSPPRILPVSWRAGLTDPKADDDGPMEVRMTFASDEDGRRAFKEWLQWLMQLDPQWGGKP